jgi:hypothetical protein
MNARITDPTGVALNQLAETHGWPLRCDSAMSGDPRLLALAELWRAKAAGGVPARCAFDMRSLLPFAKHMVIMERDDSGAQRRYKYRLFGSAHMFLFGDHTGRYVDEMVAPQMLPGWLAFYDTVLAARQPLRVVTQFRLRNGDLLQGEIFGAPMRDEAGAERLILSATFVDLGDAVPFT